MKEKGKEEEIEVMEEMTELEMRKYIERERLNQQNNEIQQMKEKL